MTQQQIDEASGEILDATERTRSEIMELVQSAGEQNREAKRCKGYVDAIMGTPAKPGPVRAYREAHPDDDLSNEEFWVSLNERQQGGPTMDLITFAHDHLAVLERLAKMGLLKLDGAAWKAHSKDFKEAMIAKRYLMPGKYTQVVAIEERKA